MAHDDFSDLGELCRHVLIGFLAFLAVGVVPVILYFGIHLLEQIGVSKPITIGLEIVHYEIFFVDLHLLLIFIWRTALRYARDE